MVKMDIDIAWYHAIEDYFCDGFRKNTLVFQNKTTEAMNNILRISGTKT